MGGFPQGVYIEDLFGGAAGAGGFDFSEMFGGGRGRARPRRTRGQDIEAETTIDFASAVRGATLNLSINGAPVTVRIPPGANEGSRVRIPGHGTPAPVKDGTAGDLLLTLHVEPHPHFKRDGDDLHLELPLTVAEAYQGARVRVPTVDGEVTMKVPPHTQAGQKMRLKGKGVQRKGKESGDLYVHFKILAPTSEDPEVAAAIEALAKHDGEDPRQGIAL
jgi:curved DNA-binding protein